MARVTRPAATAPPLEQVEDRLSKRVSRASHLSRCSCCRRASKSSREPKAESAVIRSGSRGGGGSSRSRDGASVARSKEGKGPPSNGRLSSNMAMSQMIFR